MRGEIKRKEERERDVSYKQAPLFPIRSNQQWRPRSVDCRLCAPRSPFKSTAFVDRPTISCPPPRPPPPPPPPPPLTLSIYLHTHTAPPSIYLFSSRLISAKPHLTALHPIPSAPQMPDPPVVTRGDARVSSHAVVDVDDRDPHAPHPPPACFRLDTPVALKTALVTDTACLSTTTSSSSSSSSTTSPRTANHRHRRCPPFHQHPYIHTPEPFRDVRLGPFTLHRLFLLLYLGGAVVGIHFLQNWVWPPSSSGERNLLWTLLGLVWLVALPSMVAWIVGALLFRYPTRLDDNVKPIQHRVVFRIVSRGTNAVCLTGTIQKCQAAMKHTALFPYLIEVVTDGGGAIYSSPVVTDADVLHTVVPQEFTPPNGTRFKARALHYACRHSPVPDDVWIVHLDEESHVTSSCVKGIAAMVSRTEASGDVRKVGQGMILYHRAWGKHPLLTLADMRRTGDDVGHFHLQHRLGLTIFGLHGSYVVVRQDVEADVGFDVGPHGSITEDAWWILVAMQRGVRTVWVDGYIEEQATQSVSDFLKQRRRWYVGLWKVVWHCPVRWTYRVWLGVNTFSWILVPMVLPFQIAYLALSIIWERRIVVPVRVATSLMVAGALAVYLTGLVPNMREHGTRWYRGIMWVVLQIVLFPVFQILEVGAIVMVLFSPLSQNAKGFHVVQKSGHAADGDESGLSSTGGDDDSRQSDGTVQKV